MPKEKTHQYMCCNCGYKEHKPGEVPKLDDWIVRPYAQMGQYRHLCPECGGIMYPKVLWGMHDCNKLEFLEMFSICPNACQCELRDLYRPDCENQHLKPRCLSVVLQEIEVIGDRLEHVEKLLLPPETSTTPAVPSEPEVPGSNR